MGLTVSKSSAEAGSQGLNRTNSPHEFPLINKGDNHLVDARLLHQHLDSGYQFYDWIRIRITEYGFIEGQDYFTEKSVKLGRGRKGLDYHITLDTAKELAMVEKTESGRYYRRYFIRKEKELSALKLQNLPLKSIVHPELAGPKKTTINTRRINVVQLADMLYDICQVGNHSLRRKLADQVYNGTNVSRDFNPKTQD